MGMWVHSGLSGRTMKKPTAKAVAASLRALRRAMGELRDDDVTREHLLKWRMPGPLRQIAAPPAVSASVLRWAPAFL